MQTTNHAQTMGLPAATGITEQQRQALIRLLGDEDPGVYQAVKEKIISLGSDTQIWLKSCQASPDATVRQHARDIVRHFDCEMTDMAFMAYCLQDEGKIDLERGALLMAQTEYPEAHPEVYQAVLDGLARELRDWLALSDPKERMLVRVNRFLFEHKGFTGNMENYYDPENTFLNRVLDRRTGNPVALCVVYMLLMRRLGFAVEGVGLPGHSVCRYRAEQEETYIDAFNLGKLLTREDCVQHLARCKHEMREEYLAPMSARRMLARMCGNLEQIYLETKRNDDAIRVQRYLFALTR